MQSQGGQIEVAELISKIEGNYVGETLARWLRSIPEKPKAFKVKMRPISELINFNVRSLFANLEVATSAGGEGGAAASWNRTTCQPSPTRPCTFGTSMHEFQDGLDKRRKALQTAIEIFRHKVSRTLR